MFVPPACLRVIIRNQLLQLHMIHIPSVPDNHIATYSDPLGMLVVAPEHSKDDPVASLGQAFHRRD